MAELVPQPLTALSEQVISPVSVQAQGYRGISATNDTDAVKAWLAMTVASPKTFESYRKEVERFLLWASLELGKTLAELRHEDFLRFQHFLSDPQPATRWVSQGGRKFSRSDARWRPFYQPLSQTSQRHALIVVNSLMNWLVAAGYLPGNPLALSHKRRPAPKKRLVRYLTPAMWDAVKDYVAQLPVASTMDARIAARVRWVVSLLYLLGLRLSEMANASMGQFYTTTNQQGVECWWLSVVGKGNKPREIPVSDELLLELKRYREFNDLPARPHPAESTPLVIPLRRPGQLLTRSAAHTLVKGIFKGAADRLRALNPEDSYRADVLEKASAHWLRHTAGSHMADKDVDIRVVRDNFGHESLTTTSQYLHTDDHLRHQETVGKHKIAW